MMNSQKEQIIRNYVRAYNSKDVNAMMEDLADELVFENSSNGEITMRLEGLEAFTEQAKLAASVFRERTQTILSFTHEADQTSVEISYHGILAVDLPIGLKSGEDIRLNGKSVFRFSGNKIVKLEDLA